MKVLALDLSTKSTGYAVFEDKILTNHGCLVSTHDNALDRIEEIITQLKIAVDLSTIDKVIVEDPIPAEVGHNQNVYKKLIYMQGAVALTLNQFGISLEFYTSSEWRKKCGIQTGRGIRRDTLKAADIAFVKRTYNLDVNDDEADAIGIGYAYCYGNQPLSAF